MATTVPLPGASEETLPIEACRHLVATRTGTIGYPDDHAIAVAECSLRIAEQLAVGAKTRRTIVQGALLHDVGKLRVDVRILAKPAPLTPDERREIREHPVEGELIVRTAVDVRVGEVVRGHHERWDGAGYPQGLGGAEIPLAARIVAVADAYLAMREHRPYREPLSHEAALQELHDCSGTQFDPMCVRALTQLL
jgi:HD-GYP domain-containing protein (c-di-GMP phosphodiesterase class II)